jgi:hypothetical protein
LFIFTLLIIPANSSSPSIEYADSAIQTAFKNVILAQNVGGNVTLLIAKLNLAGKLLADAENIQRSDGSINVTTNVMDALTIANQVNDEAQKFLNTLSVNSQNSFWLTITFSISSVCIFITSLALIWKNLKNRSNKLNENKPEVVGGKP